MALTNEGGQIVFESLGVRIEVPSNAVATNRTELIKISVITDVAKVIPRKHDELLPAFGIQCLPDGLRFNVPIKVTIPHCVSLSRTDGFTPIMYSGSGEIGKLSIVSE